MTQAPLPVRPITNPPHEAENPLSIVTKPFGGPKRRGRPRRRNTLGEAADSVYYPPHAKLGYREFRDLIRRAQSGDIDARNAIWIANARLAYSIANKSRFDPQFAPDVLQDLQLAIARSIRRFNEHLGYEFSTYAFAAGRRDIQRCLPRAVNRVVVGAGPTIKWFREINRYARLGEGPPAVGDLLKAQLLAGQGPDIRALHAHRLHDAAPLSKVHPDAVQYHAPPTPLEMHERSQLLRRSVASLDDHHALVLTARYGLDGHPTRTLEDIGTQIGVTRERVRQIQIQAERHLRDALILRGFDPPRPAPPPLPSSPPNLTPDPPAPEAPTTP